MKQVKQTHLTLEQGQVHRTAPGAGRLQFVCGRGMAWITMAEDPTDYILCAGERLTLAGRSPAVIQALKALEFDLHTGG